MNRFQPRSAWQLVLLTLLGLFTVQAARANVTILSDDFIDTTGGITASNGDPPDTAKWDPTGPSTFLVGSASGTLDGTGNVQFATNASAQAIVADTIYNTAPTLSAPLRLTVDLTSFEQSGLFGLHDFANDTLQLRDDTLGNWVLRSITPSTDTIYDTGVPITDTAGNTGVWVIDWTTTKAIVSLNGTQLLDTSTATPVSGPGGVPTAALRPFVYNYGGSGKVDSIVFETVDTPEPASLSLLAVGGLLMLRRRSR